MNTKKMLIMLLSATLMLGCPSPADTDNQNTNASGSTGTETGTGTGTVTESNESKLGSITLSEGVIDNFQSTNLNYTVQVGSAVDTITVKPIPLDANATVLVNNTEVAGDFTSSPITINVGSNIINILVTAEDGVTKSDYIITVDRPSPYTQLEVTQTSAWTEGVLQAGGEVWYALNITNGNNYTVTWDGKYDFNGHTADIKVSASDSVTGGNFFFEEVWTGPSVINATYTGIVYIRVFGRTSYTEGTFAIKVE